MNRYAFFTSGLLDGGREAGVTGTAVSNTVWGGAPGTANRTADEVGGWLSANNSFL